MSKFNAGDRVRATMELGISGSEEYVPEGTLGTVLPFETPNQESFFAAIVHFDDLPDSIDFQWPLFDGEVELVEEENE